MNDIFTLKLSYALNELACYKLVISAYDQSGECLADGYGEDFESAFNNLEIRLGHYFSKVGETK